MNEDILNSAHLVVAVDPGKSGAVCRMGQGKFEVRRDFKTNQDIAQAIADLSPGATHGIIELVHAFPGQGTTSMFNFGRASGVADAALFLSLPKGTEVIEVVPQVWQMFFRNLLDVPENIQFDSRSIASRIAPWSQPYLKRKLDHGTGDAVLLAAWLLMLPEDSDMRNRRSKFSLRSHKRARRLRAKRKTLSSPSSPRPLSEHAICQSLCENKLL